MDRNLQILGLAQKAGLLALGCDAAGTAARKGTTKLIVSASDASERAYRNARINADAGGAMCLVVPYTMFDLGAATGQGALGTVAFLDTGLAVRFLQGLAETQPDPFGKLWEFLEQSANAHEESEKQAPQGKTAPPGKRRTKQ
jgi:ribosomal protein L30E